MGLELEFKVYHISSSLKTWKRVAVSASVNVVGLATFKDDEEGELMI